MSSRPPPPPPVYPSHSGAAAAAAVVAAAATVTVTAAAAAAAATTPSIATMTDTHPPPAWPYALPPPHLLATPYARLPPPTLFQQPTKASTQSLRSDFGSFHSRHLPPSHQQHPPPIVTAPRWSAMPLDRILLHDAPVPPPARSPYSPRRSSQISPRTESRPKEAPKRPTERSQQLEDPTTSHHAPPNLSPSWTAHRDSESSYHSSRTPSSGFVPGSASTQQPAAVTTAHISEANATSRYKLTVRQQPLAARACGFGERDRRVIDPPPIVQLTLADWDPNSPSDESELRYPFNVVHCTLLSSDSPSTDVTAINDPSTHRTTRRLMGTLVASPFVGADPDPEAGSSTTGFDTNNSNRSPSCFFIFPDLSCRTPGPYRLHFTLMRLGFEITLLGGRTEVVSSVTSDIFQVFSAKDFPGMRASTGLTRGLKKLGAGVSVKKGNGGKGKGSREGRPQEKEGSTSEDDEGDDDEAEGTEGARSRVRKRRKE